MTQLLFIIYCLTTLLHAELVKASMTEREYSEHSPKKNLVLIVDDLPPEPLEESNQEGNLINQTLSNGILEVVNNMLRTSYRHTVPIKPTPKPPSRIKPRYNNAKRFKIRMKKKALDEHERKVQEIIKHVSTHYQSNIYLFYELRRIISTGIVKDELRLLAEEIVKPKYSGVLRKKAIECGKEIYAQPPYVWPRPNTVLIHVLKDSLNDGV